MWFQDPQIVRRFESKVDRTGSCHLWTAARLPTGYGRFVLSKPRVFQAYAHRMEVERKLGRNLRSNEIVRHSCDNPPCVNPDHLLIGTRIDNVQDRQDRERQARGEQVYGAKLTEDQVRLIISLLPNRSNASLGRQFGVFGETIRAIRDGRTWKHIERADQP